MELEDALVVSAPIGRRCVAHPNHWGEIILSLFQQPLHLLSRVTAAVEVERDLHALFSLHLLQARKPVSRHRRQIPVDGDRRIRRLIELLRLDSFSAAALYIPDYKSRI